MRFVSLPEWKASSSKAKVAFRVEASSRVTAPPVNEAVRRSFRGLLWSGKKGKKSLIDKSQRKNPSSQLPEEKRKPDKNFFRREKKDVLCFKGEIFTPNLCIARKFPRRKKSHGNLTKEWWPWSRKADGTLFQFLLLFPAGLKSWRKNGGWYTGAKSPPGNIPHSTLFLLFFWPSKSLNNPSSCHCLR